MDDPPLALRVAVASIVGGAQNWNVQADRTRPAQPEIAQSVRRQAGQQAIERRQAAAQARLLSPEARQYANRFHNGHLLYEADPDEGRTMALLRTLLESSDEEVLQLLAVALAEILVAGSALRWSIPWQRSISSCGPADPADGSYPRLVAAASAFPTP